MKIECTHPQPLQQHQHQQQRVAPGAATNRSRHHPPGPGGDLSPVAEEARGGSVGGGGWPHVGMDRGGSQAGLPTMGVGDGGGPVGVGGGSR